MPYRLHIEKQAVSLEVDPRSRRVIGHTRLLITIVEGFENKDVQTNQQAGGLEQ